jgi:hypothetical protein
MAPQKDSILAHTLARVMMADGVTDGRDATKWTAVRAVPKASRITSFVVLWAQAERELGRELDGIDEYREIWNESERSAYRRQAEFREVWGAETFRPLVDTIKKQLDTQERRLHERFDLGRAMSLQVVAPI